MQLSLDLMRRALAFGGAALLVLYFTFALVILILRYGVLPHIDHYRPELETIASRALKQRVSIAAVKADWVGLRPRLTLTDLVVYDAAERQALSLPEVSATLAWESLTVFSPRLQQLHVNSPELDIRRAQDGRLTVGGLSIDPDDRSKDGGVLGRILEQYEIQISHARIRWTDEMRGAPQLDLDNVNFELVRAGTRHRFAASATLPRSLAAPVEIKGYIARDLFARSDDANHWNGEIYANLGFLDFARLGAYVDFPVQLTKGVGALRTWVHFSERRASGARLLDVVADVRLADLSALGDQDLPPLAIHAVNGRLVLRQSNGSERLTLSHFSVEGADGLHLQSADLEAHRTLDVHGNTTATDLRASRLDLRTVAELGTRLPVPDDVRNLLIRLKPRGVLSNLQLSWRGPIGQPSSFHFATSFKGLGLNGATPTGTKLEQPGFANLSGEVSASEAGGTVSVHATDASLSLPGFFAESEIPLDHIDAALKWTQSGENLEARIQTFRFDNADAAGIAEGSYRRGPASGSKGPGFLDLSAKLTRANVRRVARYLPQSIPEDVRSYVDRALVAGSSDDVSFRVHGALERFPFRQNVPAQPPSKSATTLIAAPGNESTSAEQFRISAKLHGVKLDYAPRPLAEPANPLPLWPPIEDLEADLSLERGHMEIVGRSAMVYGFKLEKVRVDLPDLDDHNESLQVHGGGSGPLADLLQFVNTSPVEGWIDHFTNATHATGAARLELNLVLPLAHMADAKVDTSVEFQGNDINLIPHLPLLGHTDGRLEYSEAGLTLRNVSTQFLGGTSKIEAATVADRFIQIRAEGNVVAAALRREPQLANLLPIAEKLDGGTSYRATLNIPPRSADERALAAHGPRLAVESTLTGLAIDLPSPLKKAAAEPMPTRIEFDAPRLAKEEVTDQVRVHFGTVVSAILQRRQNAAGDMEIVRAGYGVNEAASLTEARAFANVTLQSLDLDAWQAVVNGLWPGNLNETQTTPVGAAAGFVPDSITAHVQALHVDEKNFTNVALNASHSGSTWQGNVASDEVTGSFSWRQGGIAGAQQNRLTARLTKLIVPRGATKEVSSLLDPSPTTLPALDITVDNFELRDKQLGRLELVASNSGRQGRREWRLEKLNLTNPDGALEATGTWGLDAGSTVAAQLTRMQFTLNATNVGNLMDRLGVVGTIKGGTATLKGDVRWHGTPLALDYDSLSGDMTLKANRGQFLKADPGVAKLLGVLSLQGLTRRLSLDFTDLFAGGFAFDEIDADVKVQDGVASTDNFAMRGVSAIVAIDGSADLARETQNLHVRVLPQINLGTGSIAYALLVNPVIGLGTLAIGEVLRDPISKALAFEYNVTGPWTDPTIAKAVKRVGGPSEPATPLPVNPEPPLVPAPASGSELTTPAATSQ